MNSRIKKGILAEQFVCDYLTNNGFTIIVRNYRKRYGEIDIIAKKDDLLSFIEVKRRDTSQIDIAEIITPSKQAKIISVAKEFLSTHTNTITNICRFDVALVETQNNNLQIRYIVNAFTANE
jgi:putative endonuclease